MGVPFRVPSSVPKNFEFSVFASFKQDGHSLPELTLGLKQTFVV